jgi:hypothetical protein
VAHSGLDAARRGSTRLGWGRGSLDPQFQPAAGFRRLATSFEVLPSTAIGIVLVIYAAVALISWISG